MAAFKLFFCSYLIASLTSFGIYGRDLIDHFGPEVLAVPWRGIFEFLFVPVTKNHFPGWGISVIFDLTFLLGGREF